jgi:hypothetical protein
MDHVELHKNLSDVWNRLHKGQLKPGLADVLFNGAGKIMANSALELKAIQMGFPTESPFLNISKAEAKIKSLEAQPPQVIITTDKMVKTGKKS